MDWKCAERQLSGIQFPWAVLFIEVDCGGCTECYKHTKLYAVVVTTMEATIRIEYPGPRIHDIIVSKDHSPFMQSMATYNVTI